MNYLKIEHEDVCNGTGLRVTVWLTACSHKCHGCFNEESWNPESGIPFDESAKQELFIELSKDYISGITFTGGDPLHKNNLKEMYNLISEIKEKFPTKTIWLYTGYTFEQCMLEPGEVVHSHNGLKFERQYIVEMCDVLVDGEYIEKQRDITLKWRGSKNQRVISIPETLKQNKVVLYCD